MGNRGYFYGSPAAAALLSGGGADFSMAGPLACCSPSSAANGDAWSGVQAGIPSRQQSEPRCSRPVVSSLRTSGAVIGPCGASSSPINTT